LAYILPRTGTFRKVRVLVPMLAAAVLFNICFWRETASPPYRRPIRFYVGWHLENSIHFADNSSLARIMQAERICEVTPRDSFTHGPLFFLCGPHNHDCDPTKILFINYCWECDRPPYFRWEVRRVERTGR